jgi:general secretion pathway protein A
MYLRSFRLTRAPFEPCSDPVQVYVGAPYRGALGTVKQVLSEHDTLVLLVAPGGYGKTALIDRLLADLDQDLLWSRVRDCGRDPVEFLRAVVLGFGFEECPASHHQIRHILEVFLTHQWRGQVPALIVEDAQDLELSVLEELRWLAALKVDDHAALNVVLSGRSELDDVLASPILEPLAARRLQRVEIQALGESETHAYIRHRLASGGAPESDKVFDEPAVSLIYRYTGGVPGRVNSLCKAVMIDAAAAGQSTVTTAEVIETLVKLHCVVDSGVAGKDDADGQSDEANKHNELGRLVVMRDAEPVCEYVIQRERVLIGRREDNDLQLNSHGVSRYHALMLLDPEGWLLIDLHSLNGTYVNSRRAHQHRLLNGDTIRIADLQIRCFHEQTPGLPQGSYDGGETLIVDAATPRSAAQSQSDSSGRARPRLVKSS